MKTALITFNKNVLSEDIVKYMRSYPKIARIDAVDQNTCKITYNPATILLKLIIKHLSKYGTPHGSRIRKPNIISITEFENDK